MFGFEALLDFLEAVWDWLICLVWSYACPLLEFLGGIVPPVAVEMGEELAGWFALAQYWVGLGDVFLMVIAYWGFALSFAGIKILVKLIPTVG